MELCEVLVETQNSSVRLNQALFAVFVNFLNGAPTFWEAYLNKRWAAQPYNMSMQLSFRVLFSLTFTL